MDEERLPTIVVITFPGQLPSHCRVLGKVMLVGGSQLQAQKLAGQLAYRAPSCSLCMVATHLPQKRRGLF